MRYNSGIEYVVSADSSGGMPNFKSFETLEQAEVYYDKMIDANYEHVMLYEERYENSYIVKKTLFVYDIHVNKKMKERCDSLDSI